MAVGGSYSFSEAGLAVEETDDDDDEEEEDASDSSAVVRLDSRADEVIAAVFDQVRLFLPSFFS